MNKNLKNIFCGLFVGMLVVSDALTAQVASSAQRPAGAERTRSVETTSGARSTRQPVVLPRNTVSRTAITRNVAGRGAAAPNRSATKSTLSRAGNLISDAGNAIIRRAFGLARNAATPMVRNSANKTARSALSVPASRARATAVFSDTSKLGDGYNNCRTAYNTCMDQFCAGANETYRRCFCSSTFSNLRDREYAMDAATTLLAQFEDNNLNAVNKTAEEVKAMYSATAGEKAIKDDTSGATQLLNKINDLLSGKKKASDTQPPTSGLDIFSVGFSVDVDDIWGSVLSNNADDVDLSKMEGVELYNNAHNECMKLVESSCEAGAVRNMAKSAYNILITQDCNAYQKKVDAKVEKIKETVRTAEKYLREARLEEYRSHNSADVNECMDKVENAILQPTACGPDFVKCLDYTGVYINSTTGDPIYTPRLFKLNEVIVLDGTSGDVLAQNKEFNQFLDSKRVYAKTALDTCRDIADTVWSEFKRNALIKISQAQDEKIEEVKMSCVSTMKECYDTQSGALKEFDDTTAQASGALAARAARSMCEDKVAACAALYRTGNETKNCEIDKTTNRIKNASECGLQSLLTFVNSVDTTRIAEGCGAAVDGYLKQLCTPTAGTEGYPWNCRLRDFGSLTDSDIDWKKTVKGKTDLVHMVVNYAIENCGVGDNGSLEQRAQDEVSRSLGNLQEELSYQLSEKCSEVDGVWYYAGAMPTSLANPPKLKAFYSNVFGGREEYTSLGTCFENTTMTQCIGYNENNSKEGEMATYDAARETCVFTDKWYEQQCGLLGNGYFENGVCYVAQ